MLTYNVQNFLNQSELNEIINFTNALEYSEQYSSENAKRKMVSMDQEIFDRILKPKFIQMFGKDSVVVGFTCTKWVNPVEIHTDGFQDDNPNNYKLGYSILIPLYVDPADGITNTVFFDQWHDGRSVTLRKFEQEESWNISEHITVKDVQGATNESFNYKLQNLHFDNINNDLLDGFSVRSIFKWSPGEAIVWHRSLFHCSPSFKNIKSKTHLVAFLDFK
jgi:hypothetical protein